jgi:Protein interacting with poly(A)-binding protein
MPWQDEMAALRASIAAQGPRGMRSGMMRPGFGPSPNMQAAMAPQGYPGPGGMQRPMGPPRGMPMQPGMQPGMRPGMMPGGGLGGMLR